MSWIRTYVLQNLKLIKQKHFDFFYDYTLDNNNCLEHVMWIFTQQKQRYFKYNDVVIFDNTYKSNIFRMPFAIFTGINNFGQSITFAGGLLHNETKEAFLWLFNAFLIA